MKKILFAVVFLFLVGCASTKNVAIDKAVAPTLKGQSVTLVQHKSPSFIAMTSGKGMFALAGVAAATASGNELVKKDNITDPATDISTDLANELNSRYGLINKGTCNQIADSKAMPAVTKLAEGSNFTLDTISTGWGFFYDGFKFSDYYVVYSANFRLIDVASSKVISEGNCVYNSKKAGKPTVEHNVLLESNSAYIKQCLEEAKTLCTEKIKNELF